MKINNKLKTAAVLAVLVLNCPNLYAEDIADFGSLQSAIGSGSSGNVTNDIPFTDSLTVGSDKNVTLNSAKPDGGHAAFTPQEATMTDKRAFTVEGGGTLDLTDVDFNGFDVQNSEDEDADAKNGGAVLNKGNLHITGSKFEGNKAAKGGAVYNKGDLTITSSSGKDVEFSNNSATDGSGDLYQEGIGSTDINGTEGSVTFSGGIAGEGSITHTGDGTLNLNADNSGYTGTFDNSKGNVTVGSGSKFFGGTSNVTGGNLNWETSNDLEGTLNMTGGNLTVGSSSSGGSRLTITGESSINGAESVTVNSGSTLGLETDTNVSGTLTNSGNLTNTKTLTVDGATKNSGTITGGTLSFNSLNNKTNGAIKDAISITVSEGVTNEGQISGGEMSFGSLNNKGSLTSTSTLTVTEDIENSGNSISASGDITAKNITNSEGSIESTGGNITASGNLENTEGSITANQELSVKGSVSNSSEGTLQGGTVELGSVTSNEGTIQSTTGGITVNDALTNAGTITSASDLTVKGALTNNKNITAEGNITATVGDIVNNSTMSATSGDIIATEGNITNSGTSLSAGGTISGTNITNTSGTIEAAVINATNDIENSGDSISASGDITAENITNENGNIESTGGNITASGDLKNTEGSITANQELSVTGSVTNSGEGTLQGASVELGSVTSNEGTIESTTGDITINDGITSNKGSVTAKGKLSVTGSVTNTGETSSLSGSEVELGSVTSNEGTIESTTGGITVQDALTNDGTITSASDLTVKGALTNNKNITAGGTISGDSIKNTAGSIQAEIITATTGDIVNDGENITANGDITAEGNIANNSGSLTSETGDISAVDITNGGTMSATSGNITATGDITNSGTSLSAGGTISGANITNTTGAIEAEIITATTGDIENNGDSITASGDITATEGNITNNNGSITSETGDISAVDITNTEGTIEAAEGNITASGDITNSGTSLSASGTISGDNITNTSGIIEAAAIEAENDIVNSGESITASGDISAKNITNSDGTIESTDGNITAEGNLTNTDGSITANGELSVTGSVTNTGAGSSLSGSTVEFGSVTSNEGTIESTEGGITVNDALTNAGNITSASDLTVKGALTNNEEGNIDIKGGSLAAVENNGSITNDGDLSISGAVTGGSSSGSITHNGGKLTLSNDASEYQGSYTQKQDEGNSSITEVKEGAKFFGGTTTIEDGTLNWFTNETSDYTLKVQDGIINIGDGAGTTGTLNLTDGSSIADGVETNIYKGSVLGIMGDDVIVTLDENSLWDGNVNLTQGTLNINGITNAEVDAQGNVKDIVGSVTASGGNLNLQKGAVLAIDEKSTVEEAVAFSIDKDSAAGVFGAGKLIVNDGDTWAGDLYIDKNATGELTIKDYTGTNGLLEANGGKLTITGKSDITLQSQGSGEELENSFIAKGVQTTIDSDATVHVQDGGMLTLDEATGDKWAGTVNLKKGGTFNYGMTDITGTLTANEGNLNLLEGSILKIKEPSIVEEAVAVDIQKGAIVEIEDGAEFTIDSETNDKWNGTIQILKDGAATTGGSLTTEGIDNTVSGYGGGLQQNTGSSTFDKKSNIHISDASSYITGGEVSIKGESQLSFGAGVQDLSVDKLNMGNNTKLSIMNGEINYAKAAEVDVDGTANFSIDLDPRNHKGDQFEFGSIIGRGDDAKLNISDFNFQGGAPIDRYIYFELFTGDKKSVDFAATKDLKFTPIGWYGLQSMGEGMYRAYLDHYNPQVFRGQVATIGMYTNQLMVDDIVTNHFSLQSERMVDKAKLANKYSADNLLFAPYQHTYEDGGLWNKSYASFQKLDLTQNLNVGNNVYGTLLGADLPAVQLKNNWKFIPTGYVGYNGAHQHFNGVSNYQNGGQLGVMGTFLKNNFVGSVSAYGGGYLNEMDVAGYNDETGNWFAGAAAKAAYNLKLSKTFTFQPNLFAAYNGFGKQNWHTDYGIMGMQSGLLNGANIAPGANFIFDKDTWSLYATIQYMFFINDRVNGRAGNVNLPNVRMNHGYIQYGFGGTKVFKDTFAAFGQFNILNAGITGIGLQAGLMYKFDTKIPFTNKKQNSTGEKKYIKK